MMRALRATFALSVAGMAHSAQAAEPNPAYHLGSSYLLYCGSKNAFDLSDNQATLFSLGVGVLLDRAQARHRHQSNNHLSVQEDYSLLLRNTNGVMVGHALAMATCPDLRRDWTWLDDRPVSDKGAFRLNLVPNKFGSTNGKRWVPTLQLSPNISITAKGRGVYIVGRWELN